MTDALQTQATTFLAFVRAALGAAEAIEAAAEEGRAPKQPLSPETIASLYEALTVLVRLNETSRTSISHALFIANNPPDVVAEAKKLGEGRGAQ